MTETSMRQLALVAARFCISAWVGVATFFVTVVIQLRGSPLFTDPIKLNHPKVLFPLFYGFEFGLLGVAFAGAAVGCVLSAARPHRDRLFLGLIVLALGIGIVDWYWIYRPLAVMLDSGVLPENFRAYHTASRWLNTAALGVAVVAAGIGLWPTRDTVAS